MLTLYTTELVRRQTWMCLSCSTLRTTSQALIGHSIRPQTSLHQRKNSSSKTSRSSKDETRSLSPKHVPRPNQPNTKDDLETNVGKIHTPLHQKLPKVPSTDSLNDSGGRPLKISDVSFLISYTDIQIASLFAQHRPISLSTPVPSETSPTHFASIFESKSKSRTSTAEVIFTLNSVLQDFEQATSATHPTSTSEPDLQTIVNQASTSNADPQPQHLDLPAKSFHINLQELSKKFLPFAPPPPPIPLAAMQEAARKKGTKDARRELPVKQRTYTTTLTVYESTNKDGKTTYETHSTPLVEEQRSPNLREPSESTERLPSGQPRLEFLKRMRDRRTHYDIRIDERYNGKEILHAISVKRQRKLKMKKHKYKKLMKRTKNLRRRLDRT